VMDYMDRHKTSAYKSSQNRHGLGDLLSPIFVVVCRNAGFDPAKFRVDPYGNVVYWNADPSSPLAWEIDHWFPHSRMLNPLPVPYASRKGEA
jgi:hypothetical protein